ncbi:hypothetical protein DPMN_077217 [Dreissena polymorpha]|uniref:Uncharacterized protein n=1 Tax=Dreissena polymorpha TaxID=45954 RepID=A0A9D4BGF9_DREPO|nr:hypothetical protein DPMN_077217 [Dreissena polymorpha]
MEEKILIARICVGVAVVTALVVAIICCCRIKRHRLLLHFEAYSVLPRFGTAYATVNL